MDKHSTLDFDRLLKDQALGFADELRRVLAQLNGGPPPDVDILDSCKSLELRAGYIASISFVGMVNGEFVLAFDDTDAFAALGVASPEDVSEALSEALNMVAGARLGALTARFPKLTITPPRLAQGSVKYRGVRNVPVEIRGVGYRGRAFLLIDRMKLDIAESYQKVIQDLGHTNEELSAANAKLRDQQAQLVHSEKMASLGMMAAGVAHEINNPLAFVSSNTDVLDSYVGAMRTLLVGYDQLLALISAGKSDEARSEFIRIAEIKQKEDLSFILEDTRKLLEESKFGLERIRGIVNGLKRFSRVDDGGLKSVLINDELQNTLMLLQNELKYRCKVATDLRAEREMECLPGELSQVFVNLIVNAAQAIKRADGVIEISTADDAARGLVVVQVKDNGVGIPAENLPKLFSPFFTTKPVGEGTGLGLAIAHGIIQKHGGRILVESEVGVGTRFTVELPLKWKEGAK